MTEISPLYSVYSVVKGTMKTKYRLVSLKGLLHPANNVTNFIANFKEIMELLGKTGAPVVTPQPLSGNFSVTSQNVVSVISARPPKPLPKNMTGRLQRSL